MCQLPFSENYRDQFIVLWDWDWCWWVSCDWGHRRRSKSQGRAAARAPRPQEALLHSSTSIFNVGKDR